MVRIGAFISTLVLAVTVFVMGSGGNSGPTIPLPDAVVLFGADSVQVNEGTNVLGGDTATNNRAQIGRDVFFEGSLLADDAQISRDVTLLGILEVDRILGVHPVNAGDIIRPRTTDDYEIPALVSFQPGKDDIRIKGGETAMLQPGSYRNITIDKGANVTFEPGTYSARRLHVGQGSILTINGTTVFNITNNLSIGSGTTIDLATDLAVSDLTWNYSGHGAVYIGSGTFGVGIVTTPNATLQLGATVTWRGRLIAKRLVIGKNAIVSPGTSFALPNTFEEIVTDTDGSTFPVNEVVINLTNDGSESFAREIADMINGRIAGFSGLINLYVIEVETADINALNSAIDEIEALNDPRIEGVFRNYVLGLQ